VKNVLALTCIVLALSVAAGPGLLRAAEEVGDEKVQTIVGLVSDKDKDLRAVGLQQVREGAKGAAATRRFAALLPKLSADAQAALLVALADRGDKTARPAALDMLKSPEEAVRVAAIQAVGSLGEAADVPRLVSSLAAAEAEKTAAHGSLARLPGAAASAAIVAEMKQAKADIRAELIGILLVRRAFDCVPNILSAAQDADAGVRKAAMAALGQLAGPEHIAGMMRGVLKAEPGTEREAAEKAVMLAAKRIEDPDKRADAVLAPFANPFSDHPLSGDDEIAMLPTLGRVGGTRVLEVVEAEIAGSRPRWHEAGVRALCNWPDASVAPKLLALAQTAKDPTHRTWALRALIRVAALPDKRPAAERLDLLKTAMTLATRDEERNLVLGRCRAVRTIETLRFLTPYLDKPALAQQACASVVELAHHRELREPNKAEFDRALDTVIRIGRDPDVVDRAKRYKKGQT
jgi:hypothetical protein